MGSIRGFRCEHCHAEVLATASHAAVMGGAEWTPPVLCCSQSLRPLETGQVLSAWLPRRRLARCTRCGFEVCIIVHPVRPLVCAICQAEFAVSEVDARAVGAGEEQLSGWPSGRWWSVEGDHEGSAGVGVAHPRTAGNWSPRERSAVRGWARRGGSP